MPSDSFADHLAARIEGEVAVDRGSLAAYASDASNHRVVPHAVAFPRSVDDLAVIVATCVEEGLPITSRGAGTNVAGSAIGRGVVLDHSRYLDQLLEVDVEARTAVVRPGLVLDNLQGAVANHGLRFGPDPSTHNRCTLGGMIGTNACGSHSVAWGTTADNVLDLELLGGDGTPRWLQQTRHHHESLATVADAHLEEIRTDLGRFPRQISGYGLQHLLPEAGLDVAKAVVGSEGTCGIVTAARVRLVELPRVRALVVLGYSSDVAAAVAAPALLPAHPLTVEGIDSHLVQAFDTRPGPNPRPELPPGAAWLLIEVGGADEDDVRRRAEAVVAAGGDITGSSLVTAPADQRAFWTIRERGAGLATRTAEGTEAWPGWEDSAVPPARLGDYLSDFHRLMADHGRHGVVYGHFGEGCLHVRVDHDMLTEAGRQRYRTFQEEAADLVVRHGGSLSGEHGDGRARSELLSTMYQPRMLAAFGEFKRIFDPDNVFNPGIIVDPAPLDADLRWAISRPHTQNLAFAYEADDGDFGKAMRRCVGVGACRKPTGGAMCPSYRATKDERHSTRGRARLLFEMLDGHLADDGWRSEEVHDALDLCLGCKACSNECPVSVDMATYKAEFLHQHYKGRLRPASHYSMGWLPLWLRAARWFPRLANLLLRLPLLARAGGIDRHRSLPRLATKPLRRSVTRGTGARPITLFVDTFTASFEPEIAQDAVAVLAAAGYDVRTVGPDVCCGLTWVSTGQLDMARRVMTRAVAALGDGPGEIVVLEPSCAAALKGDLPELLGTDEARAVSARIRTLAEVVLATDLSLEPLDEEYVAQFHCHQRSTFGTGADRALLARMGVSIDSVDEGCCGLAGNFGFEKGHWEISVECAEQSFLPVLRDKPSTPILADGFSCRLQIEQIGERTAMHLASLLRRQLTAQDSRGGKVSATPG